MDTSLLDEIKNLAASLSSEVVDIRRHLHKHPELSFEEVQTSAWICGQLDELGIPYTRNWAGNGIVAEIQSRNSNKVVALRADMDALPILEANEVSYKSVNEGVMHACGHDVHMACLIGAVRILNSLKEKLPYCIRIIFQPGEEKLPGGASMMIREGVLESPIPIAILGQHVFPSLAAGKVGIRSGLYICLLYTSRCV